MRRLLSFILFSLLCMTVSAQNEIKVNYLGNNNTMVKLHADSKYLLLPIEESAPEAQVNILIGGHLMRLINVRLAQGKRDYFVPLKLDEWKGKDIVLNIRTGNDRSNVRDSRNDVCWNLMKQTNEFDSHNTEKFRPAYHHTPLYGWMNDPNGMFYKDGVWHLYYQYNPYASVWANMTWGHSTSRDLMHWEHQPEAIWGDCLGSIFSGSAVVDKNNTSGFGDGSIVAIYTSAGMTQQQSLAYSIDDGMTFTKYDGNPIMMSDKECRDDNFFWDEPRNQWALVLADAQNHQDLFFTSKDLKNWTRTGEFGQGYGAQDGVWECPDLMQLPVNGTKQKKWVLIVNINPGGPNGGSATQYFIGNFDGNTFKSDDAQNVTRWLDYGKDHYAAVSWSNAPQERHTIIGWMSNWQYANAVPTKQYRSANTLPRDLSIDKDDNGKLYVAVKPSAEVDKLLEPTDELTAESSVTVNLKLNKNGKGFITLSNDNGEKVVMTYDAKNHTFSMDRTKSGEVGFSDDFPCTTVAPTTKSQIQTLRLFIDHSSIEAFDANGRFSMTNLVFPSTPYNKISVVGDCKVMNLNMYKIKL
jgi:fructan beta-fructosidase